MSRASDAFITKLSPDGSRLVFSTFLGGNGDDAGGGISLDGSGFVYVAGGTQSQDFPLVDPIQMALDGGYYTGLVGGSGDAFIAKIRPDGSGLVYSTYFGGSGGDGAYAIAVDAAGNAYVTGAWGSRGFPTTALSNLNKGYGAFILKIAPTGSTPLISTRGVVNGASFQQSVLSGLQGAAIGGIISLFGKNITNSSGIVAASSVPLPTELNGVSVAINGVRAPLFAVANVNGQEQINFQLPFTASSAPFTLTVFNNGAQAVPITLSNSAYQPGIFTTDGTTGAIQHGSTYQLVTPSNPAKRGEVLVIYATGLGAVSPDPGPGNPAPSSPPAVTTRTPTVTIGGVAAQVQFSGLAPGFVGLNQVNVQVPQGAPSGNVDVVMTVVIPNSPPLPSSPPVKLAVESAAPSSRLRSRQ